MIDKLQIVQTEAQPTAAVRFTIPRSQIHTVMGPAMAEVMAAITAAGLKQTGPLFSYHFRMDPEIFDFEVGAPVSSPITASGRVQPSELPAVTVARTTYHGPYEGLGEGWGEFMDAIEAEGHTPCPNLWEFYVTGPESGPDSSTWQTQLNRPLQS